MSAQHHSLGRHIKAEKKKKTFCDRSAVHNDTGDENLFFRRKPPTTRNKMLARFQ